MALSVSVVFVENNLLLAVLPRLRDATEVAGVKEEEKTGPRDKNVTALFRIVDCRIMLFFLLWSLD